MPFSWMPPLPFLFASCPALRPSRGKKQNNKIKLGICGEHGGDPKSINFCSQIGLNYVSCSPYRVPIARLAAAQAELKKINYKKVNL